MKKAAVFLADGFEEIEALSVVDILRRAGIETNMVSISSEKLVAGAHKIEVKSDALFKDVDFSAYDAIVLPGGIPGTTNLGKHKELCQLVSNFNEKGGIVSAICAAPTVLAEIGVLKGKNACCYPGCEEGFENVNWVESPVCVDGNIITSRGVGTAIDFALALVGEMLGNEKAKEIGKDIVYKA